MIALVVLIGLLCLLTVVNMVLTFTIITDLDRLWLRIGGRKNNDER